jgi:hypothetical protein
MALRRYIGVPHCIDTAMKGEEAALLYSAPHRRVGEAKSVELSKGD